jgi:hypothetical protein
MFLQEMSEARTAKVRVVISGQGIIVIDMGDGDAPMMLSPFKESFSVMMNPFLATWGIQTYTSNLWVISFMADDYFAVGGDEAPLFGYMPHPFGCNQVTGIKFEAYRITQPQGTSNSKDPHSLHELVWCARLKVGGTAAIDFQESQIVIFAYRDKIGLKLRLVLQDDGKMPGMLGRSGFPGEFRLFLLELAAKIR